MKKLCLLVCLTLSATCIAQQKPKYDAELAKKLGADDYGMKHYMLVILKTGERDSVVKKGPLRDSLFRGHMANIGRLAKEGKLVVAGPFGKNSIAFRGLFILNVKTAEEASLLLQTDPTIREKLFAVEIVPWYGSAALPEYLKIHKSISKENP